MKPGETISNKDISLKFVDYVDSRCPEGATCITAGYAAAYMEMSGDSATVPFTIGDGGSPYEIQFTAMSYKVRFVDLRPYPKEGETLSAKDYKLYLNITKL